MVPAWTQGGDQVALSAEKVSEKVAGTVCAKHPTFRSRNRCQFVFSPPQKYALTPIATIPQAVDLLGISPRKANCL
jgi:hypothetical protein